MSSTANPAQLDPAQLDAAGLDPARLDPALFRRVLGHVPTAVSVVTAISPKGPVGMTVGSFTSISLDPALAGFFATSTSNSLRSVLDAGRFTANVLADSQSGLSQRFAGRSENKFDDVDWTSSPTGTPRLPGALAWIDCQVTSSVELGDHIAVIGAVEAIDVVQHSGRPLVFFRGRYCHLDSRTLPRHENWRLDHYAEW